MIQEELYVKDISRDIEGVISAESKKDLAVEVDEFVITDELAREAMLPKLFKTLVPGAYPTCTWISGDFGSGKSHLLKILSYVFENELVLDGKSVASIFTDKIEDFELKQTVKRALSVPTETILFNIATKADGISQDSTDPVLAIFVKEFNNKLGFDSDPAIADIERYFTSKGKYEWFKDEYRHRFNAEWIEDRDVAAYQLHRIAEIFADMEGIDKDTAERNIDTRVNRYRLDIAGFVDLVRKHVESSNKRLIFCADEVGQFIGTDVHRMLSLQTIAEGLKDIPNGMASVIVTSQMDLNATVGNLSQQQKHDFSRIQGRFTTRLSLTSANADEVIRRRVLEKKPEAQLILLHDYEANRNIIRSLFDFGEGSQFKCQYRTNDRFGADFPFVDYQFDLLQSSIVNLSKNNAFTGSQQSVGERSMIEIMHTVAKKYSDADLKSIVRFSDMYEGLRGILQARISDDIKQAERTLDDSLALDVLKTLFLLKYVAGFPTTVENITKLLLPTIETDFPAYQQKIQEALNKLLRQSYIEKGAKGDYHFQTNEEKDIENEIKNQELSPDAVSKELMKMFRDEVFSENKISLSPKKVFSFGRYVDDQKDGGGDSEVNIHFITPNSGLNLTDVEVMNAFSFQHPGHLCVVLPADQYLPEDLAMFKKADSCLSRLFNSGDNGSYRQQIIADKRQINRRRRENIVNRLTDGTKVARLFLNGSEINVRANELKPRLIEGMTQLIKQVYHDLEMLDVEYDDDMLKRIINEQNTGFWDNTMDAAMTEVFNHINRNRNLSIRSVVSELVKYFKGNTYGWYEMATLCILAKLYKLDRISFRSSGNVVDERDLYRQMTNSNSRQTLIVDVEETITQSQISTLKKLYRDLFDDETCLVQGAREVHNAFVNRLNDEIQKVKDADRANNYEFAKPLSQFITSLTELSRIVYPGLYGKNESIEDAIDYKEDHVENILSFVDSSQFEIFKQLDKLLAGNQANLAYVDPALMTTLTDIHDGRQPWSRMEDARVARLQVHDTITRRQEEERAKVISEVDAKYNAIKALPSYASLKDNQRQNIDTIFNAMKEGARQERFIGNLIAYANQVNDRYNTCLDTINRWVDEANRAAEAAAAAAASSETSSSASSGTTSTSTSARSSRPMKKAVNKQRAFSVAYPKPMLESKEDVDTYLAALRTRLMGLIDENTNIMLN